MDIDKYIRDYNFKIIDKKALIGAEIESKSEEGLYYNVLTIIFYKDAKEVHREEADIPFIPAKGLCYFGRIYDYNDFDEIKLSLKNNKVVYEESYYPNIKFGLDEEKTNGKHLEYKVINDNNVSIPEATLNLLFYNRGELVCGADVKLGKLINGRTYYFVYDVPEGLEYTDVNTELTVPNTGILLFKSYYNEYCRYETEIEEKSIPNQMIPHESLDDLEETMNKKIDDTNKRIKNYKNKSSISVKLKEIFNVLKSNFKKALVTFLIVFVIFFIILSGLIANGVFGDSKTVFESLDKSDGPINLNLICPLIAAVVIIIVYTIGFIKSFKEHKQKKDILSKRALRKIINEENKKIEEYKTTIEEFKNDKEKLELEIEKRNKEIDKENEKISEKEEKRRKELQELRDGFKALKEDYPEYAPFEGYSEFDRLLCELAFENGAITFESVSNIRQAMLSEIAEKEKYEQEMAMRRKEQQLMAEQTQAIKDAAWAQRYASQQITAEIQKQASMQQSLIQQQIAASDRAAKAAASATAQVNMNLQDISLRQREDMTYNR